MTRVITNKDGRMETLPDAPVVTKADVDRTRRELRDMLSGNTQFHEDAKAAPLPTIEDREEPGLCLDSGEFVPARQLNQHAYAEVRQHAPTWDTGVSTGHKVVMAALRQLTGIQPGEPGDFGEPNA